MCAVIELVHIITPQVHSLTAVWGVGHEGYRLSRAVITLHL